MKGPPRHYPRTLARQFASDPFDPRMHAATASRDHTPLGLLIEIHHWYQMHKAEIGPAFAPIAGSIEALLRTEAPDALAFLEKMNDDS
jgi:hypothetical protein